MQFQLVTAATTEPVSLEDLKSHLRGVAESDSDFDLNLKLLAAREYVEDELGRRLLTSTWDLFLPYFPNAGEIQLPWGKLQSVAWIKYKDIASVQYTVDPKTYIVVTEEEPGRIVLAYQQIWPVTILQPGPAVSIRFTCGWPDTDSVPVRVKQAILILAADMYRNREASVTGRGETSIETAFSVSSLLRADRLWRF